MSNEKDTIELNDYFISKRPSIYHITQVVKFGIREALN